MLLGEQRRNGGAGGATTNDNDIALSTVFHRRRRLQTADWETRRMVAYSRAVIVAKRFPTARPSMTFASGRDQTPIFAPRSAKPRSSRLRENRDRFGNRSFS